MLRVDIIAWVARFMICARHLCEKQNIKLKVTSLECQQGLPDVPAFHIESRTCLEEVTIPEFSKHSVVILGIVTSDVSDLQKIS